MPDIYGYDTVYGRSDMILSMEIEGDQLENIELREEIKHSGGNYLLQTSYIVQKRRICSSFFRDGRVFDSISKKVDGEPSRDELKELTKAIHQQNRDNFRFLLNARDSVRKSDDPNPEANIVRPISRAITAITNKKGSFRIFSTT